MSDVDPNLEPEDDDTDPTDRQVALSRKDIRALEKMGKDGRAAVDENERLKRELAFAKAGVDTDTEAGQIFMRGYNGDLEVEAVKTAAQGFGLTGQKATETTETTNGTTTTTPAPTAVTLQPGEDKLSVERQALSTGAAGDTGIDGDPYQEAIDLGRSVLAGGGKELEALGAAAKSLANRAHQGDRRVIIDSRSVQGAGEG